MRQDSERPFVNEDGTLSRPRHVQPQPEPQRSSRMRSVLGAEPQSGYAPPRQAAPVGRAPRPVPVRPAPDTTRQQIPQPRGGARRQPYAENRPYGGNLQNTPSRANRAPGQAGAARGAFQAANRTGGATRPQGAGNFYAAQGASMRSDARSVPGSDGRALRGQQANAHAHAAPRANSPAARQISGQPQPGMQPRQSTAPHHNGTPGRGQIGNMRPAASNAQARNARATETGTRRIQNTAPSPKHHRADQSGRRTDGSTRSQWVMPEGSAQYGIGGDPRIGGTRPDTARPGAADRRAPIRPNAYPGNTAPHRSGAGTAAGAVPQGRNRTPQGRGTDPYGARRKADGGRKGRNVGAAILYGIKIFSRRLLIMLIICSLCTFWWYRANFYSKNGGRGDSIEYSMVSGKETLHSFTAGAASAYYHGICYTDFSTVSAWLGLAEVGSIDAMRYVAADAADHTAAGSGREEYVIFRNGSETAVVNGTSVIMPGACRVVGSHIWIPLSFIENYIYGISVEKPSAKSVKFSRTVEDGSKDAEAEVSFKLKRANTLTPDRSADT